MSGDGKKLETKHAHITGQAMRDHWGPIVDRIAAETSDPRDAWISELITENERLESALKRIAGGWPKPMQLARETLEQKK